LNSTALFDGTKRAGAARPQGRPAVRSGVDLSASREEIALADASAEYKKCKQKTLVPGALARGFI